MEKDWHPMSKDSKTKIESENVIQMFHDFELSLKFIKRRWSLVQRSEVMQIFVSLPDPTGARCPFVENRYQLNSGDTGRSGFVLPVCPGAEQ